jgi:hypothetical protein
MNKQKFGVIILNHQIIDVDEIFKLMSSERRAQVLNGNKTLGKQMINGEISLNGIPLRENEVLRIQKKPDEIINIEPIQEEKKYDGDIINNANEFNIDMSQGIQILIEDTRIIITNQKLKNSITLGQTFDCYQAPNIIISEKRKEDTMFLITIKNEHMFVIYDGKGYNKDIIINIK